MAALWVADVGNTHVKFGPAGRPRRPIPTARIARLPRVAGESAAACVVPRAVSALRRRWPRVRFLGRDFPAAIGIDVADAREVGADRLALAAAAWARCRRACVVVGLGTAVTYNVVSARGVFVGGAIGAGLGLQSAALHDWCAQLPRAAPARARRAIARTTGANLLAGVYFGVRGAIVETLGRIRRELGARPVVFGAGGDAALFADCFDVVERDLVLEGVVVSYRAWKA